MPGASGRNAGGGGAGTPCIECGSPDVRPSRSFYPMDKEKIGESRKSFWRCGHCGARFLGPFVAERKHRHYRPHHAHDPLAESIGISRLAKRWIFPLIVLVLTALAVAFILERRNRPTPTPVISPAR